MGMDNTANLFLAVCADKTLELVGRNHKMMFGIRCRIGQLVKPIHASVICADDAADFPVRIVIGTGYNRLVHLHPEWSNCRNTHSRVIPGKPKKGFGPENRLAQPVVSASEHLSAAAFVVGVPSAVKYWDPV